MSIHPHLLIITGDHGATDSTKWSGGYTEDDLALHQTMVDAFRALNRFRIEVCTEHDELLARLLRDPRPDLVVNFCDTGFGNVAEQELHVPALLDIVGLPYTGATPRAMVLAYDKSIVHGIATSLGLAVPRQSVVGPGAEPDDVIFPAFVKPATGDGSVGI
ncbi:MAG: D-alanine--D-alanine ligase, partial [Myxococcota bacterium]